MGELTTYASFENKQTTHIPMINAVQVDTMGNQSTIQMDTYNFHQTVQVTFIIILFALIFVGNSFVLAVIFLSRRCRSRMNIFIINLAIADLSVGFLFVLTDAIWKLTIDWHAGDIMCKVVKFGQVAVSYGSTYALVALSIDRFYAISKPLSINRQAQRSKLLISMCWLFSFVFSLPMFFVYEEALIESKTQCWVTLPDWAWPVYMTIIAMTIFFIPLIIIAVCYIVIVIVIWRKSILKIPDAAKKNTKIASNVSSNPRLTVYSGVASRKKRSVQQSESFSSSRGLIPKAKIKTVKMTFVIILAFILCWSPYFIFDLLWVYQLLPKNADTAAISTFMQSLAPLNSAANPIIYMVFNTNLCKNLFRRRRSPNIGYTNAYITHV